MKVKYTTKDVRAGTTYVEIDRDQHTEILGYLIQWLAYLNEGIRDPRAELDGFFEGQESLPKMSRGKQNSVASYIAGILNNQVFIPNKKTGRYQTDFTLENVQWIGQISIGMSEVCGTPVIEITESMWN